MDEEDNRVYLHTLMVAAFPNFGIFFRPPGNIQFERPSIIYDKKQTNTSFANNGFYVIGQRYQIHVFTDIPGIPNLLKRFEGMSGISVTQNQSYTSADIVHDVFTVDVNSIK